jgi:hypothetical protein
MVDAPEKKKACPKKSWPLLTYEKHQHKYITQFQIKKHFFLKA